MSKLNPNITALRLQLLDNGYSPLSSYDKRCFMKKWPTVHIDETLIEKTWARQPTNDGTAIRVENGLCVIDIDINHRAVSDVVDAMLDTLPEEIVPDRLERSGKGFKLAWFVRTEDLFSRLHTRKWVAPGDTVDDETHCIEIFGGGSPRYFGSFGPHTKNDRDETTVTYKWADESPEDVPLNALHILTKSQLFAMLDAAEAELKLQGFTPVARTKVGEGAPGKVYDLTEDMVFDLATGEKVGMLELQQMVRNGYDGRCSADWMPGETSGNTSRCLVRANGSNHLAIWESAAGMTHLPASIKPTDHQSSVNRVAERLSERQDKRRSEMSADDDAESGAAKLLLSYAYMANSNTPVVPLWSRTDDDAYSLANFRTLMMPYCSVDIGPRGGEKRINPVDLWLANPARIHAAGRRMRPDRDRPSFEDQGCTWINTYRPPDLGVVDDGVIDGGLDLIEQLVPDKREREWFMQWLAYKWQNPHIPGPSIIMVARQFGTGRGTLGELISLLFGKRYVANVSFKMFAGQTYQSQYTDWALNSLFAIVNESSATGEVATHKARHDVYEHLKETVDPRPTEKQYVLKKDSSVMAVSAMTCLIMTNNIDAIPLPKDDRRFAVLTNGEVREPEFWTYINAWMEKPSNIAALGAYMDAYDVSQYNPFEAPLMTLAKEEMADMSETQLDRLIYDAISDMDGYFVVEQVIKKIAEIEMQSSVKLPDHWQDIARRETHKKVYFVRYKNERKVSPQIKGVRYHVLHTEKAASKVFENAGDIRFILAKNGNVFGIDVAAALRKNDTVLP